MPYQAKRPVLILEGAGDREAVPLLIRRICHENAIYDFNPAPHPKLGVEVPSLERVGELERYLRYADISDGDSILLAIDIDDHCPAETVHAFADRARALNLQKRLGIAFFNSEYESLFLNNIQRIADARPEYGWDLTEVDPNQDFEEVRGAKEKVSRLMQKAKAYKETRDQVKFTNDIDLLTLRETSRSFQHLENTILWFYRNTSDGDLIYPSAD
jgi:hypothetical protein